MQIIQILLRTTTICILCFSLLFAQRKSNWYKNYDKGNRYEGSYVDLISGGTVDIISLYGGFTPYEFGKGDEIIVNYYAPQKSPRYLKAEELQIVAYYWMEAKREDAQKGWNIFSEWPVDDELRSHGVPSNNLGVLIRLGGSNSRTIAPAWINQSPSSSQNNYYTAYFRLGLGIRRAKFEVYKGNYQDRLMPEGEADYTGIIGRKSGGSYFPVRVPFSTLEDYEGWVTVRLSFQPRYPTDNIPDFEFYFYHTTR